jgi:peroxiredoxin
MTIKIGDSAPAFTLKNSDCKDVSLTDYKGKTSVLLFFPLAFTGVCTEELCHMRDNLSKYENLNAEILAVSVDSPFTLAKFKAENNLNFPVLSDFNKDVSQAYGAFYEDFVLGLKGVSKRAVFVIDGDGKIQYQEVLDNAGNLPNFTELENALAKLN